MKNLRFNINKPEGKLGVLLPGMGSVCSTFVAGIFAILKGLGKPVGSITQLNHIRLGRRDEKRNPLIKDLLPLYNLQDLVFGGWDIFDENLYESAVTAGVLEQTLLDRLKDELILAVPFVAAVVTLK